MLASVCAINLGNLEIMSQIYSGLFTPGQPANSLNTIDSYLTCLRLIVLLMSGALLSVDVGAKFKLLKVEIFLLS